MTIDRASTWPYTLAQWHKLPLPLRQRWWKETDYSRNEPSGVLLWDVRRELFDN